MFQDIPFSLPFTYQALGAAFGDSKLILTVRSSPQKWYGSVVRSHSATIGKSVPPRPEELKAFSSVYTGWLWKNQQLVYGASEETVYNCEIYMRHYMMHNLNVVDYSRFRPGQLLMFNVAEPTAMKQPYQF